MDYLNSVAMIIWYWSDAPQELRDQCVVGGDEDYLAYVPPNAFDFLEESWFGRMTDPNDTGEYNVFEEHSGTSFGGCSVHRFELPNGARVYIGTHA